MIHICPNGELIDTETGEVIDYSDFNLFPPMSRDAQTLFRHWDGVSAEPLGTIPKIISIGKEEQRLLRKIRPWKFFKTAVRSDYYKMLNKINKHRFSLYQSIRIKNLRGEPYSVYNSTEYKLNHLIAVREAWKNPIALLNKSNAMIDSWIERRLKFGPSGFSAKGIEAIKRGFKKCSRVDIWKIRRERYGPRGVKDPKAVSKTLCEAQRKRWRNGCVHQSEKIWATRIERYGPTGTDPKVKKEACKRGWETRRRRYGETGRKN